MRGRQNFGRFRFFACQAPDEAALSPYNVRFPPWFSAWACGGHVSFRYHCASTSRVSSSSRRLWPHRRPLRICRARLHLIISLSFADRLRAGAAARGGALSSGRRPGRVHWGRPLLSRPRGAFSSGAAAVESAADTGRIRSSRGRADQRMCSSWVWIVVRFVCVIRVPVCARVSRVCPGPGFPATTAPPS